MALALTLLWWGTHSDGTSQWWDHGQDEAIMYQDKEPKRLRFQENYANPSQGLAPKWPKHLPLWLHLLLNVPQPLNTATLDTKLWTNEPWGSNHMQMIADSFFPSGQTDVVTRVCLKFSQIPLKIVN
jgi:hypothetical protein